MTNPKTIEAAEKYARDCLAEVAPILSQLEQEEYYLRDLEAFLSGAKHEADKRGWVKCSERLPEKDGDYEIVHSESCVGVIHFSAKHGTWNAYDFEETPGEHAITSVHHWREIGDLPSPPAADLEGGK
jgi:hypothetical protein